MKKILLFIIPIAVLIGTYVILVKPIERFLYGDTLFKAGPPFSTEVMLKTTPVKDQGNSPLCWVYAMLATIETEHLMQGDSVNLSPDYVARMWLTERARFSYLSKGKHTINMRGMASMTLNIIQRYGLEPFDAYPNYNGVNYNVMARTATQIAHAATSFDILENRLADALNHNIGYLPPTLFMFGVEYTPLEFAHSVCLPGEYEALTSFTHHPFGQKFVLETPDNQLRDSFMNVPLDSMMTRIEQSLRNGHPVCWEGDISEPGFNTAAGCATLDNESTPITQQQRQRAFETLQTTDDHCMELCGIAHDIKGDKYFIAKNSWGKTRPYGGFMYLSFNYVRAKTIAVYLPKQL